MKDIRIKSKHWKLGEHFCRFIDKRWYPNFVLGERSLRAFIKFESYGPNSLEEGEKDLIKPLLNGKENEALTIKMLHEEIAECWSEGHGYWYPLAHTLQMEFEDRAKIKNNIYLGILRKIYRALFPKGEKDAANIINLIKNYTGFSDDQKDKYLSRFYNRYPFESK